MKKVLLIVFAGAVCALAYANEPSQAPAPQTEAAAVQDQQPAPADFKQAREKHEAHLKATQEKMTTLVGEYNKLKAGKKKEAKKAEIAQAVATIHEEQIQFKEKQLAGFEKRLNQMKEELAAQSTSQAKEEWVNQRTEKLIEEKGDMRVLFDKPLGMGQGAKMHGAKFGPKHGGPAMKGPKGPQGPHGFPPGEPKPQVVPAP